MCQNYLLTIKDNSQGSSSIFQTSIGIVQTCSLSIRIRLFCSPKVHSIDINLSQRFLAQTGGHTGGWDDYDHQLFLKLKSKHKASILLFNVGITTLIEYCLSYTMYFMKVKPRFIFRFQTLSDFWRTMCFA